jgi:hypothetical protein
MMAPICFKKLAESKNGVFPSTIATSNHISKWKKECMLGAQGLMVAETEN